MSININDIKSFITVTQTKNITRAAEIMGMTQPTLSYAIKRIEEALDVELIVRLKNGVELTKAGEDFFLRGRHAIAVGVLEKKQIRRHAHIHPTIGAKHCRRPSQSFRENGGLVKPPVANRIYQPTHAPELFVLPLRVADHLHHKQPSELIKTHRHRIRYQRLRRRQLQVKLLLHGERLARILWLRVRDARQLLGIRLRISC